MAARKTHMIPEDTPIEEFPTPPDQWREVPKAERTYNSRDEWVHEQTGVRVRVRFQRRPTQMHTPETSKDDTGFATEVCDDVIEQITHDLASKWFAYRRAYELMLHFPDGDFEPEYRDHQTDGPRTPEEW